MPPASSCPPRPAAPPAPAVVPTRASVPAPARLAGVGLAGVGLVGLALAAALLARPAGAQPQSGTVSGRVTGEDGQPIAGVTVAVTGTPLGAITRADGNYRLTLRPGSYELRARLIGYAGARAAVTVAAGASVTQNFRLAKSASVLQAVTTTGTRAENRTVVDAPAPVDVLTAAEIRSTGRTETAQIIQMLAPSFNFPRPSVTDGTDHVRPASLRGLGPDQVLVLVNGKRRYTSALVNVNGSIGRGTAAVDLNAIPAGMIERIEVLRDGAAAQYGSDAIAGVINVILKSTSPGELSATLGRTQTTYGGETVDGVRTPEVSADDGAVVQLQANWGRAIGQGGHFHVGGEFRDRGYTNRTLGDPRPQSFEDNAAGRFRDNATGPFNHRQGDAAVTDGAAFYNTAISIGGVQLYSFGGLGHRRGEGAGFFRRPLDDRTVRALYPEGFLPLIQSRIWDGSTSAGARGTVGGFRWDLSTVYGQNSFNFNIANSNNVTLGAQSPREFDSGTLGFRQSTSNLDLQREFRVGPALAGERVPIRVATGAEFRRDNYTIDPGDPDSYRDGGVRILDGPARGGLAAVGAQVFPGFRPTDRTDASRNATSLYLDLETELTRRVLLTGAVRYEDYSDFGDQTTWRVATRVSPVPQVNFRASLSTGFRAPSLQQNFFSSTATNFIGGLPFDVRTFPVGSREAQVLGAVPLRPETSENYSYGVALEPFRNFSVSADWYGIDIADRIVFSENFTGADIQRLFEQSGLRGVTGGRFFTNAIDTRTRGLDVIANYGLTLGDRGTLRLTGGYNRNRNRVTRVIATPPQLGNRGEALFGRAERGRIEVGQPRDNVLLSALYDWRRLGVTLRTQRFGEVTSVNPLSANPATQARDQVFGAKWVSDVSLNARLANRATLTIGADNVFDVYPDQNDQLGNPRANFAGNSNFGIFPYSGLTPFGFNGRFVYTRVTLGLQR